MKKKNIFELLQDLETIDAELEEIKKPDSAIIQERTKAIFPDGVQIEENAIRDAIKKALAS